MTKLPNEEERERIQIRRFINRVQSLLTNTTNTTVMSPSSSSREKLDQAKEIISSLLNQKCSADHETRKMLKECQASLEKASDGMNIVSEDDSSLPEEQEEESVTLSSPSVTTIRKASHNSPKPKPFISQATTPSEAEETTSAERIQVLLQARKDMYEQELEQEYGRKKELLEDLVGITGALKESTLGIHQTVRKQNVQLDQMQHFAWQNADSLDQQRKKLAERSQVMQRSLCGNLAVALWAIALFLITYLIIRALPVQKAPAVCPA
eukprot:scaffold2799_cov159-Ochromonas_danica.AAC.9